jgi:hypothetical protein
MFACQPNEVGICNETLLGATVVHRSATVAELQLTGQNSDFGVPIFCAVGIDQHWPGIAEPNHF